MNVFRYIFTSILIIVACMVIDAQTSFRGVNDLRGYTQGDLTSFKKNGMVAFFKADSGVQNASGQISSWNDQSGNGYHLRFYAPANQPSLFPSFGTNIFPTIAFTNKANGVRLNNPDLGKLFNGVNIPFTIIALVNAQTNTASTCCVGMGWDMASNAQGSIFIMVPNGATPTQNQIRVGCDSNQNFATFTLTGGTTTNIWRFYSVTYDGSNFQLWDNLTPSALNAYSTTIPRTCNTFSVGAMIGSNNVTSVPTQWTGQEHMLWVGTNALMGSPGGTTFTNTLNALNSMLGNQKVY